MTYGDGGGGACYDTTMPRRRHAAAVSAAIAVVILVIKLRAPLVRWMLLNLAGERRLVTFYSTPYWGLGNFMFAFSSTLGVSRVDSRRVPQLLCFDAHVVLRAAFSLLQDWPSCNPNDLLDLLDAERIKETAYARYDRQLVRDLPRDRHVVIDRYLQSWKYFANVDDELRHLFRFSANVLRTATNCLRDAVGGDHSQVLKVGLHVRRGDIVEQEELQQLGYVVADMSYIERAMDRMDRQLGVDSNTGLDAAGRRRLFIVCSNDMNWCQKHMPAHRLQQVRFVSTEDPIIDLAILSMCQHTVITVGTFGWWAAWLANGTTIYYKDWPRQGSPLAAAASHDDYFPPHWIPL